MPPTKPTMTLTRLRELDRAARNALIFYGDGETAIPVRADELAALTGALLKATRKPQREAAD